MCHNFNDDCDYQYHLKEKKLQESKKLFNGFELKAIEDKEK